MTPDNKERQNLSLDDLFAIKRAERPPQEFWNDFQREFHVRQRAAAVEPKRWWFVLPRVFAGLSRYQMPMGAAAVLAVTFLSFREYREPGFEIAYTPAPAAVDAAVTPSAVAAAPELIPVDQATQVEISPAPVVSPVSSVARHDVTEGVNTSSVSNSPVSISPMVVWAGVSSQEERTGSAFDSPSARSIAANLAAIQAEQPEIVPHFGDANLQLTTSTSKSEPLADVSAPASSRRPLFVFRGDGENFANSDNQQDGPDIHSRIASRLSDDQLYESVRRVTAGGDRLTLKF